MFFKRTCRLEIVRTKKESSKEEKKKVVKIIIFSVIYYLKVLEISWSILYASEFKKYMYKVVLTVTCNSFVKLYHRQQNLNY